METKHYYGDMVRKLFLGGAVFMLLTLPFVNQNLPVPLTFSISIILILSFIAGLINPVQKTVNIINVLVAAGALAVFEYYAVDAYIAHSLKDSLFWINQILAINFLFALYFSSKTARGQLLGKD